AREHHTEAALRALIRGEDLVDLRPAIAVHLLGADDQVAYALKSESLFLTEADPIRADRQGVVRGDRRVINTNLTASLDVCACHGGGFFHCHSCRCNRHPFQESKGSNETV